MCPTVQQADFDRAATDVLQENEIERMHIFYFWENADFMANISYISSHQLKPKKQIISIIFICFFYFVYGWINELVNVLYY